MLSACSCMLKPNRFLELLLKLQDLVPPDPARQMSMACKATLLTQEVGSLKYPHVNATVCEHRLGEARLELRITSKHAVPSTELEQSTWCTPAFHCNHAVTSRLRQLVPEKDLSTGWEKHITRRMCRSRMGTLQVVAPPGQHLLCPRCAGTSKQATGAGRLLMLLTVADQSVLQPCMLHVTAYCSCNLPLDLQSLDLCAGN